MNTLLLHRDEELHGCAAYRYWIPCRWMNKYGINANYIHVSNVDKLELSFFDLIVAQRIPYDKKPQIAQKIVYDTDDDLGNKKRQVLSKTDNKRYLNTIRTADAVTVSTKYLKSVIEKHTDRPVFVCPNLMDLELIDKTETIKNKNPVFGLIGGRSHYHDWKVVQSFIMDIMQENKEWHFYIIGFLPDYLIDVKNKFFNRVTVVDYFVPYPLYIKILKQVDVRLSPLEVDKDFNYSKSPIAALEMMACRSVSIAQNINVYSEVINHENGLLCNNEQDWYSSVSKVLNDNNLRKRIAEAGRTYVENNYDAKTRIIDWIQVYQNIMRI